ncbi:MAG: hypothetical protein K2M85_01065, partial [Paramuribaculum sp.]|nr:hypothetical protein [Paramuribaculum sp.]
RQSGQRGISPRVLRKYGRKHDVSDHAAKIQPHGMPHPANFPNPSPEKAIPQSGYASYDK